MKRIYTVCIAVLLLLSLVGAIIFESIYFTKKMGDLDISHGIQIAEADRKTKEAAERAEEARAEAEEAEAIAREAEKRAEAAEKLASSLENKQEEPVEDLVSAECKLYLGDPLLPWLAERMGCKLPHKTVSIDIDVDNEQEYAYFVAGYEDPAYLNCVYDSGWQRGSRSIALADPELYYVFVSSIAISEEKSAATQEDADDHKLTAWRKYTDSVYHSSMMPPRYYFEDGYMQGKVEYIRELLKRTSANGDAFMFITDEHWEMNAKQSPKLANYLSETTGINKIFSGGDRVDHGYDFSVAREFMNALGNDNYFPAAGNHDFGDYGDESLLYASSFMHLSQKSNVTWGDEGSLYYYVDDDAKKIRYIVLQAFEPNPTKEGLNVTIEYNDEQIEWFKNEALNVDEGYTILIFSHVFLYGNDSTKEFMTPDSFDGYGEMYDAVADYDGKGEIAAVLQGHFHWGDSTEIYRRTMLSQSYEEAAGKLIYAVPEGTAEIYVTANAPEKLPYRVVGYSGASGEPVYDSGLLDKSQKIDLDDLDLRYEVVFEKKEGVEIDSADLDSCKAYSVRGSIPLVVTACDRYAAEYPPSFDQSERAFGTITEQAFDVVVLDKLEKKLYFVRIGAPTKESDGSFTEVREFYYA